MNVFYLNNKINDVIQTLTTTLTYSCSALSQFKVSFLQFALLVAIRYFSMSIVENFLAILISTPTCFNFLEYLRLLLFKISFASLDKPFFNMTSQHIIDKSFLSGHIYLLICKFKFRSAMSAIRQRLSSYEKIASRMLERVMLCIQSHE